MKPGERDKQKDGTTKCHQGRGAGVVRGGPARYIVGTPPSPAALADGQRPSSLQWLTYASLLISVTFISSILTLIFLYKRTAVF